MKLTPFQKGVVFSLLAAFISGVSIFYNKVVVIKGIDSTIFNIVKNCGAGILLTLFLFKGGVHNTPILSKKLVIKLILIGIIGGSLPFVLFFEGLKGSDAVTANIIQKSMFIWVSALAIPILKERVSVIQIFGFVFVLTSNFIIGGFTGFKQSPSELLILSATLLWSFEHVFVKRLMIHKLSSTFLAVSRMVLGTLLLLIYAYFSGKLPLFLTIRPDQYFPIFGSVLLLTGYVFFWYKALSHASVTIVTSILVLATPITNILTAIFITHTYDSFILLNLVLSTAGIFLISYFSKVSGPHVQRSSIVH